MAPKLVVALGATAVLALTGKAIPITRARGPFRFDRHDNRFQGFITVHPSYLLRLPDEAKAEAYAAFVDDLRRVEALGPRTRRVIPPAAAVPVRCGCRFPPRSPDPWIGTSPSTSCASTRRSCAAAGCSMRPPSARSPAGKSRPTVIST